MKNHLSRLFVYIFCLLVTPIYAFEFVQLDFPGAVVTRVFGNDENKVVGWYEDELGDFHGFVYDGVNWQSLDFPGSSTTKARGIDGDTVVGFHVKGGLNGFVYDGEEWISLRYPDSINTMAFGVKGNKVVGEYKDSGGVHRGFIYEDGSWTTLDFPGAVKTHARNIDDQGNILGWYSFVADNDILRTRGFIYDGENWTSLLYPDSNNTSVFDNIGGKIVGSWMKDGEQHGFVFDGETWQTIDFPGAQGTRVRGIDSRGNISGWFWDDSGEHGFTGRVAPQYKFLSLDYPGSNIHTYIHSIDQGRVVGLYRNAQDGNRKRGFLYDGRRWQSLDFPGSDFTEVLGINGDSLVGAYQLPGETIHHGFLYENGDWMTVDSPVGTPGLVTTRARDIEGDNIVGFYQEGTGTPLRGFLDDGSTWLTLMAPGSANTTAFAIDQGNVVGTFRDTAGLHGFLFDGENWAAIDYVGANSSELNRATGISGGRVVGWFGDLAEEARGLLYDFGIIWPIEVPDSKRTVLRGVDENGNIVGWYRDASNRDHGFIGIALPVISTTTHTYGYPRYNPIDDKNLFIWSNKGTGKWHVRVSAGGGNGVRYVGRITTSSPITMLNDVFLESSDLVELESDHGIYFDVRVSGKWQDGFDFRVPTGTTVQVELNDNTDAARDLVEIGGFRWPANELPIQLSD